MSLLITPDVVSITKTGGTTVSGAVTVTAGTNVTITQSGQDFSFASTGGGMSIGGTVTSGTTGSVLFVGTGPVLAQDNAQFFWDHTNKRLGIGTASPSSELQVTQSQVNLFQGMIESYTSTGFTNAGALFNNPVKSTTISLTEIAEQATDGGNIVFNNLVLDFTNVSSGSPDTSTLVGFNNSLTVTQPNGVVPPDVTAVQYNTTITNTGGGTNNFIRSVEYNLALNGAFGLNSFAYMTFRSPVLATGASINTQNCIIIEGQGGVPTIVGQGTTDAMRWAGTAKFGANSAIAAGFKVEVTGAPVRIVSGGLSIITSTAASAGNEILISGQAARGIFMQRETTSSTAGNTLTITSGGAVSGGTDLNPGKLVLAVGAGTGNGGAGIDFQTVPTGQGSGTTDRNPTTTIAISAGGLLNKYNNINTVSNGVPSELATVDSVTQSAAITATTIYTPAATGMFRLSVYLQVTRAASTSSILGGATGVVITYTDGDGSVAQTDTVALRTTAGAIAVTSATNTTATNLNGDLIIYAKTGVAIQYAIGYTSVGGTTMQFAAHLKVEAL